MLRLRLREVKEPASTSQPGSCKSDLAHARDSKAVALNHRAPLSLPEPPPPQLDGCRLGPGLTAPEQLGVGVPSPADAAAGEGRLLGGSVGEFPEAAARLPLHRRPTLRQAEEDISGVSVCRGAGGGRGKRMGKWVGSDRGRVGGGRAGGRRRLGRSWFPVARGGKSFRCPCSWDRSRSLS